MASPPRAAAAATAGAGDGRACSVCGAAFSLLRHKHHCRRCGAAVCGGCSTGRVPVHGPVGGDLVKACDRCLADHRAALREARNAKRGARPGARGHGSSVVDGARDAEDSPPAGHIRSASDPLLLPGDEDSRSPTELRAAAAQERARSSELRRNGLAAAASRAFQLSKGLERQAADVEAQHAAAGATLGRATAAAAAPALPPNSILSSKSADIAQLVPGSVAGGSATPPTGGDSPRIGAGGRRTAGQPLPPGRSAQAPPPRRRSMGSGVTADDEKDPEILRMLAELGWTDADVSRLAPPRSDASVPSAGHGSSSRGGDHLRSKALAAKKAALALKREGRAAEALAEMKRAKQLEAEAEEADILGACDEEEGDDDGGDNVNDLEKLLGLDQHDKASGANDSYFADLQGLPQLDHRSLAAIGIGDTEDDDVGSKGNSVDLDEDVDEQDLDDPQMAAALREMGWEEVDTPLVKVATGQGGLMAAPASAPEAPVLTRRTMEAELGASRQRAVALKREGRTTEALAEMRRAKGLEMALAEGHQKQQQQQQQQQPAPLAVPAMSSSPKDTGGSDFTGDDNNDDNDIDVTDEDLNDPDMAAALADLGWSKDADGNKGAGRGVQEPVLRPPPSSQMPLALQLAEAAEEEEEDDDVEVTDSDLADPDIAAVLKGLGWKEEEVTVSQPPAKVLPAAPNLQPAMATQGMLGTGNGSGTVSLQEQVEVHRSRALAWKREGRSAEALEEMRKSKAAAAQLEDLLTDVQAAVDAGLGTVPAIAKNGFMHQPQPSSTSTAQLPAKCVLPPLASVSVSASAPTSAQSSRLGGSTPERRLGTRSSTGRPGTSGQRLETAAMTADGPALHDPLISSTLDLEPPSKPEQLLVTNSGGESTHVTTASSGSAKASAVALRPDNNAAPIGRGPTERSNEHDRIKNMAAAEEAEHGEQAFEDDIAVVLNELGVIGPSSTPAMLSGRHSTEAPGSRNVRPAHQQPKPSAQSMLPIRQGACAPSRMTMGGFEASASLASSMMVAADQPSTSGVSSAAITGPLNMQPPAAALDASENPSGVVLAQQIATLKHRALALRKEGKSAEALDCLRQIRALASRQAGQGGLANSKADCVPMDSGASPTATQRAPEPMTEKDEHAPLEDVLDPQQMATLQGVGMTIGLSKEVQQPPVQVSASEEEKRKLVNEIRAGKLKALSLKREGKKQEALESLRVVVQALPCLKEMARTGAL
eukprot:SM000284S10668  [mRNA]  locus=s284:7645:11859:- [translate_table: standard]